MGLILLISRYAERLMWIVCFTIDRVVSMYIYPAICNMAFEGNDMTSNSQVIIL